jgi:hypothetical protein
MQETVQRATDGLQPQQLAKQIAGSMQREAHLHAYAGNGINRVFATITIKEGVLGNILLRRRAKEALRTNLLR